MGPTGQIAIATAGTAVGVVLLDQASKALVRANVPEGDERTLDNSGWIGIGHVHNHGSAYGLVPQMPTWAPIAGAAIIGAGLVGAAATRTGGARTAAAIGAGLVLGGATGNIVDRVQRGHVTDMLRLTPVFGYFNIADVAINVGLGIAAVSLLKAR